MNTASSIAIARVALRNYKSIAACDVALPPLTFLVGPNGSGKSDFLDALRFVAQALRFSPEHALRERAGMGFYNLNPAGSASSSRPTPAICSTGTEATSPVSSIA